MVFKRRFSVALILFACGFLCESASIFAAPNKAQETTKNYSGYGSMSLKATTAYLFPGVICKFNDVDPESMVSWDVDKASSEAVLNQISKQINIEWNYQNKILVFKKVDIANAIAVSNAINPNQPIAQYIKPEPVKEVVVAPVATSLTSGKTPASNVPVKASLKPNEEIVEWEVKSPKQAIAAQIPQATKFDIRLEDESVSLAMRRWTSEAGYQLAWEAEKDFPAHVTSYPTSDVVDAIQSVMTDTASSNFPLHACVYDNKVIRVLPIAKGCTRTSNEDGVSQ